MKNISLLFCAWIKCWNVTYLKHQSRRNRKLVRIFVQLSKDDDLRHFWVNKFWNVDLQNVGGVLKSNNLADVIYGLSKTARHMAVMSGRLEARRRTRADKVGLSGWDWEGIRSTNLRIPSLSNMPSCQNKSVWWRNFYPSHNYVLMTTRLARYSMVVVPPTPFAWVVALLPLRLMSLKTF